MEKIIGFLNGFHSNDPGGDFEGMHMGAMIASAELLDNIITHGGYDCHHFLYEKGPVTSPEGFVKYVAAKGWNPRRLLLFRGALPLDRIAAEKYHVLFRPDFLIDLAISLRNTLERPIAPAVGIIHTVSYAPLIPVWTRLLVGNLLPCDALVCTSRAAQQAVQNTFDILSERFSKRLGGRTPAFRGQLPIIPLGVDVDSWKPESDKRAVRRQLGLPDEARTVLCPARFSCWDKMDLRPFLMGVARLLPVLGPDFFRVVLVGDNVGDEANLIREFAADLGLCDVVRIDTDGTPSRLRLYYRAADIFVSLVDNLQETFGLTVTQAMACGLPTIVSDWNGYKDTVVHGETGYRVRTYWAECDRQVSRLGIHRPWYLDQLLLAQSVAVDVADLMDALLLLIGNPDLCQRMGQAGRRRAEEMYAWPVVIKKYAALWEECQERFTYRDAQEWVPEEDGDLFTPAYFRQFSHYPSAVISSDAQLALRPARVGRMTGWVSHEDARLPAPMEKVFHPAIFDSLRTRLQEWPITLGELVDSVRDETGHTDDQITRHVMWLIKYGVVEPVGVTANAQSVCMEGGAK